MLELTVDKKARRAAPQIEATEELWQALDGYLARHPDARRDIDNLWLLEPEDSPAISEAERDTLWSTLVQQLRQSNGATDPDSLLEDARKAIKEWVSELRLTAKVAIHIGQIRAFTLALGDWITDLNASSGLEAPRASVLRQAVIQSSFPVLQLGLHGRAHLAARCLVGEWQRAAALLGLDLPGPEVTAPDLGSLASEDEPIDPSTLSNRKLLWSFQTAVFQLLRTEEHQREGLEALIDMRTSLDLDSAQLGRLLEVSEDRVRSWEEEEETLPGETAARLSVILDSMRRLRSMFLPERLPQVVRRPAELFGDDSALEWILQGRIREVADRYDLLLRYQA